MGRQSDTYVEGWNFGFWDGIDKNGKRVGGMAWFEPDPPSPFPEQTARREARKRANMSMGEVANVTSLSPVQVSQWEHGKIELTPEQIAQYDAAVGYTE